MGIKDSILRFVVTCAFTGYLPPAPGTYGALLACGCIYFFPFPSLLIGLIGLAALVIVAVLALQSLGYGSEDPSYVTIDEFVGMLVTMVGHKPTLHWLLIGFLLFRILDVVKPPPVRQAEGLKGAYGILADDVVAGILANMGLSLCAFGWGKLG